MNFKQSIPHDDNLNIYAAPELIRFGVRSLENKRVESLLPIICNKLTYSSDNNYLISQDVNTVSMPMDSLYLMRCKNAYITETYGVHDCDGLPYWNSVLSRGSYNNNITYPRGFPKKIDQQLQPLEYKDQFTQALYINYLQCKNFGHLLTETASSLFPILLWIKRKSPLAQIPIIINEFFSSQEFQINTFMNLTGITRDQIILVGKDTRCVNVQNLYLAYPTHVNRRYVSRKHANAAKTMLQFIERQTPTSAKNLTANTNPRNEKTSKVYISRSQLNPNKRHIKEEKEIESLLQKNGWEIFHPQLHSIALQKNTYEKATFICGAEGSALHLLYGCNLKKLERVILLSKNSKNNFTLQLDSQRIRYKNISCLKFDPSCTKRTDQSMTQKNVMLLSSYTSSRLASIIQDETTV